MKPLTIEELKSLEVGDWVWIELQYETGFYALVERRENDYIEFNSAKRRGFIAWYNYGTKWLAFKNKEQAEAKGEIVELPCLRKTKSTLPKYEVVYIDEYDKVVVERFTYENCAQSRLAELKGEEV